MGSYTRPNGDCLRLGSMITEKAGERGSNFLLPEIARLARREVAYRQPGAFIEERRLWCNLLSSMPMTLNLLGPLRLNPRLATKMLRAMFADLADATVEAVLFEYSPGRGSPQLTHDATAFDAAFVYSRPSASRGLIGIETKFSEALAEPAGPLSPRFAELAQIAGLHRSPKTDELTRGPLRQFFRQHLLAQATLMRGDFSEGRFVVIAPELNTPLQAGIRKYADTLVPPSTEQVGFLSITLERMIDLLGQCGERGYAAQLFARYCDWSRVDEVIEAEIAAMGQPPFVGNDNVAAEDSPAASAAA
jgi:hypothetical protein